MDSFVQGQIRRSNRNFLLANVLTVSILVVAGYFSADYLHNFFEGPFPLEPQMLDREFDAALARGNFFRLDVTKALDTGFREVEQTTDKYTKQVKSEKVSAEYVATNVGGRLLLLKVAPGKRTGRFEGDLKPLTSDIYDKFINPLAADDERFRDAFVPQFLDSTGYRTPGYIGLAVAALFAATVVWNVRRYASRLSDPRNHPALVDLARYGDAMTVASMIDSDLPINTPARVKNLRLTATWLASQRWFGCDFFYIPELVWIYKKATSHYYNFIPNGKTYSLVVNDARGYSLDALDGRNERVVNDVLEHITAAVPWAVFGYSDELKRVWSEDPAAFAEAVFKRRDTPTVAG